jgi:hypothetical protein
MKVEEENYGTFCPDNWTLLFCDMSSFHQKLIDNKHHALQINFKK